MRDASTEDTLIVLCQAGDPDAFGALVTPYRRPLFAYLARMSSPPVEPDDLLQDTLMRVWKGLPTYQHDGRFRAWLFRIAHNTALNALNRSATRADLRAAPAPDVAPGTGRTDAPLLHADLATALERAVRALPARQRRVFLLRQDGGLLFREIAETTDEPLSTVLSHMHYATTKLRAALAPYNDA